MGVISSVTAANINNLASSDPKALMNAELYYLLERTGDSRDFGNPSNFEYDNHTGYVMDIAEYKSSTLDAATLALVFHDHYERSGDSTAVLNQRKQYASEWYNELA